MKKTAHKTHTNITHTHNFTIRTHHLYEPVVLQLLLDQVDAHPHRHTWVQVGSVSRGIDAYPQGVVLVTV